MQKLSNIIVEKSRILLVIFVLIALLSVWLMTGVDINSDMTKYLPDDSTTKVGIEIMDTEFPAASSFNLMFKGLKEEDKAEIYDALSNIDNVQSVLYDANSEKFNKDDYTLYIVSIGAAAGSPDAKAVVDTVTEKYSSFDITISGEAAGNTAANILPKLAGFAFLILLIILFVMCNSWIEPFLFLVTIAIAIVINMGSNVIFDSVSETTQSIAAILQLCLSIDYSIILINRYRQEKQLAENKNIAMKKALRNAFAAISSSSITTIVGMLALVFMSFTIGKDMGFVLAKGVFLSLICIFTVLPGLILMFDMLIEKTAKKSLHIKMDKIASFSYSARYVIPVVFLILFVASFFLKGNVGITYTMSDYYEINKIFPPNNPIVIIYENEDEEKIGALTEKWDQNTSVDSVNAYSTTLGKNLTSQELSKAAGMDETFVTQLFDFYTAVHGEMPEGKMALYDFMQFIVSEVAANEQFKPYFTDDAIAQLEDAKNAMEDGLKQLVGTKYSRLIINTSLAEESDETFSFIDNLKKELDRANVGENYILGNSAVAREMSASFPKEMNLITILTVIAIFAVVAVAFHSLSIPLILVCIIQCAVFITMGITYIQGSSIYYLPLLIVQCLLLGATVDYGILYTSYYREARITLDKKAAIIAALNNSIHTILTSALILIVVTGVLGVLLANSDQAISEILLTIAKGGFCATVLVIFILPGLMSALDGFVCMKNAKN